MSRADYHLLTAIIRMQKLLEETLRQQYDIALWNRARGEVLEMNALSDEYDKAVAIDRICNEFW